MHNRFNLKDININPIQIHLIKYSTGELVLNSLPLYKFLLNTPKYSERRIALSLKSKCINASNFNQLQICDNDFRLIEKRKIKASFKKYIFRALYILFIFYFMLFCV